MYRILRLLAVVIYWHALFNLTIKGWLVGGRKNLLDEYILELYYLHVYLIDLIFEEGLHLPYILFQLCAVLKILISHIIWVRQQGPYQLRIILLYGHDHINLLQSGFAGLLTITQTLVNLSDLNMCVVAEILKLE